MIVWLVVGGALGFIIGALVFRNNASKMEALVTKLEAKLDALKEKL